MSLLIEYINKKYGANELEKELLRLISQYNKIRGAYLFVYASAIGKPIPDVAISQDDYYIISDILKDKKGVNAIDVYLETPGGSGEAVEEIVEFFRENFAKVSFVISGEAKSAGTIMVLSGDEILMTKTASLGPIDAQMRVGRTVISAYDYMEWVDEKYKEAESKGKLNPFDATMIAQINPGELKGVNNALKFAEDVVVEWLKKYKFKNWNMTETKKTSVTDEMKEKRAKEIVNELVNHSKWRLHGRSIKIDDLETIGLKITSIDALSDLKDIVYRIQTVCRLFFEITSTYKIFATQEEKIFKHAIPGGNSARVPSLPAQIPDVVEIVQKCNKCGKEYKIYVKLLSNPQIDEDYKKKGFIGFPKDSKLKCDCGVEFDLGGIKNEIESKAKKKILV